MKIPRLTLASAAILSWCLTAWAGEITLSVSSTIEVRGTAVEAAFKLTNQGTDTADNVVVSATFMGQTRTAPSVEHIAAGESHSARLAFTLPAHAKGSFPVYVQIRYRNPDGATCSTAALATARTAEAPASEVTLSLTRGTGKKWGELHAALSTKNPRVASAIVTCHCPEDLSVKPQLQKVTFKDGRADAQFVLANRSASEGSLYALFFSAEYDLDGAHGLSDAGISVPIESTPTPRLSQRSRWQYVQVGAGIVFLAALLLSFLSRRARSLMQRASEPRGWPQLSFDILALIAIEAFVLAQLRPEYLVTATTTTGGDTGSHYYTLEYLRNVLLPAGRVSFWTPGNYAGFPILQMYFPLPFLGMCLLDLVMPLQVAFKLGTLFGTFLLPIAAYSMLRSLRTPFPGPAIGALFTLPFLFNTSFANNMNMWGGNLLSTLAGEFSYSLSMALSLILLGSLYRGCMDNRRVLLNAFLVFLVGFSHGYTLLFAEAMSAFLLITPRSFVQRAIYLGKVYALGFCLLAFWIVPLLAYSKWTTPYHTAWTIDSFLGVIPPILVPVLALAAAGGIGLLVYGIAAFRRRGAGALHVLAFLTFGLVMAGAMFVAAPRLGVVDIRYVPYAQLMACLMAALALGWLGLALHRWGLSWALLLLATAATLAWVAPQVGPVPDWCKWNYEGFEAKPAWPTFEKINSALRGNFQDPRVVFEHSSAHNAFGTTRAFESLPLFAGRATLEGLYMQASVSAPFVFYIQSEVSQEKSCPFPQYTYANMDFRRARPHLKMFNVRDLIIRSTEAKAAIRAVPEYQLQRTIGEYELWKLTTNRDHYVVPLENEPVLYATDNWKVDSHRWFTRNDLLDRHLVFASNVLPDDLKRFKATASSMQQLPRIPIDTSSCKVSETVKDGEILIDTNWLRKPLLVKMSYHPDWHVEGADRIYLVSPSFMLIYPEQEHVRLYYGPRAPGRIGAALTVAGILVLLCNIPLPWKGRRTAWSLLAARLGIPESLEPRIGLDLSSRTRWTILVTLLLLAALVGGLACYRIYTGEPHRLFNRSVMMKDAKRFAEARQGFRKVMASAAETSLGQDSAYYIAICYYLQGDDAGTIAAFEDLLRRYPDSHWTPDAHYHIGLCLLRSGQEQAGIARLRLLREEYPNTPMARYAADRLREHGALEGQDLSRLPQDTNQRMGIAIRFFNEERLDEALPIFEDIYTKHPEFVAAPQALACAALCRFKRKDWAGTIPPYELLMARYPQSPLMPEALYHIGLCLQKTGRKQDALSMFRRLRADYPQSPFAAAAADRLKELGN